MFVSSNNSERIFCLNCVISFNFCHNTLPEWKEGHWNVVQQAASTWTYSLSPLRETHSKATAVGGLGRWKMTLDEINVKEEENVVINQDGKKSTGWVACMWCRDLVIFSRVNMHVCHQTRCVPSENIHPPHLAAMSSSSPPHPQYWLGKPFIFMYWSGVTADTPPKYCWYGSLGGTH